MVLKLGVCEGSIEIGLGTMITAPVLSMGFVSVEKT